MAWKTVTKCKRSAMDGGCTSRRLQAWLEQKWVKEEASQYGKLHSSRDSVSTMLPSSLDITLQFLQPFHKYWLTLVPLQRVSWPPSLNWGHNIGTLCSVLSDSIFFYVLLFFYFSIQQLTLPTVLPFSSHSPSSLLLKRELTLVLWLSAV